MRTTRLTVIGAALLGLVVTGPVAGAASTAALPDTLARKVTMDGINRHLIAVQRFADRNGGNRADPSRGFQESLEYVTGKMRAAGFDVSLQEFSYQRWVVETETLVIGSTRVNPIHMTGSPQTPLEGVTTRLAVALADTSSGCQPSDYAGNDVAGAVVLTKRGGCTFADKTRVAAALGAVATIVYNNSSGPLSGDIAPAVVPIPVVGISGDDGARLAALAGAQLTLVARAHFESTVSHNLIAQTRTGRTDNVVLAGAFVGSVASGPGLNDNGSGTSALLELALQLGSTPRVNNAVRFIWWGGGLESTGSQSYLASLDFERQLDIALFINVAPISASNGGYFIYDGDNSDGLTGPLPYGSAQIEQAFTSYLNGRGIPTEGAPLSPATGEYVGFVGAGIPTGGPYAGIHYFKTEAQAAKWGGTAGITFHPCNDAPCDNLGGVNRTILDRNADAIAHVTGTYAMSTEDVNGVPPRAHRAALRQAKASARMKAAPTGLSE